jgi:hypothetical protein
MRRNVISISRCARSEVSSPTGARWTQHRSLSKGGAISVRIAESQCNRQSNFAQSIKLRLRDVGHLFLFHALCAVSSDKTCACSTDYHASNARVVAPRNHGLRMRRNLHALLRRGDQHRCERGKRGTCAESLRRARRATRPPSRCAMRSWTREHFCSSPHGCERRRHLRELTFREGDWQRTAPALGSRRSRLSG